MHEVRGFLCVAGYLDRHLGTWRDIWGPRRRTYGDLDGDLGTWMEIWEPGWTSGDLDFYIWRPRWAE